MALFIFAILLAVGGLGWAVFAPSYRWVGVVCIVFSPVLILGASYNSVGARQVGIPETFGSLGQDLQPGVHWLAPWANLHQCSLAQQQSIMTMAKTEGDREGQDGITINGADQGQAYADVFVLYHNDPLHARDLYKKYGCDEDAIKDRLIRPAARNVIPALAANIPSLDLKGSRADVAKKAVPALQDIVAKDGLIIDNVLITELSLSKNTQDAADAKLAAQQGAQTAEFTRQKQEKDNQTATLKAAANQSLTASLTPQVLCDEWIKALAETKPATLLVNGPCGTSGTGVGSVIVDTRKP